MSKPIPYLHIELNEALDGKDFLLMPMAAQSEVLSNPATLYQLVGQHFQPDITGTLTQKEGLRAMRSLRDGDTIYVIRRNGELENEPDNEEYGPAEAPGLFYDNDLYVILPDGTWWTFYSFEARDRYDVRPATPIPALLDRTRVVLEDFFQRYPLAA